MILRGRLLPVHPRIRGEHAPSRTQYSLQVGSSPHTRGTFLIPFLDDLGIRFIPAYAGNILLMILRGRLLPVHPRIRGEHLRRIIHNAVFPGSSPHTRGTLKFYFFALYQYRFIPAYAGNIAGYSAIRNNQTVHPRIRGEHLSFNNDQ